MPCCCPDADIISTISDISSIFTAIAGTALALYVFIYQRKQDERSHRLQWFKDLIIDPNKSLIYEFYAQIIEIAKRLGSPQLVDYDKSVILQEFRNECASFRRNFIKLIQSVDSSMEKDLLDDIDRLSDFMTQVAFDPLVNLSDEGIYENTVSLSISRSKNYLLARIFRYDGALRRKK